VSLHRQVDPMRGWGFAPPSLLLVGIMLWFLPANSLLSTQFANILRQRWTTFPSSETEHLRFATLSRVFFIIISGTHNDAFRKMQFDAWTKLVHHKVFTETTISMGQTKPPPYPCTLCKAIRPRADVVDTTKKGSIGWWCAQRRFFYGLKDAWFYLSPKELGGYFNGTVGGISPTPFLSPSSAGAFDWYFVIDDDTIVNLYALQDFLESKTADDPYWFCSPLGRNHNIRGLDIKIYWSGAGYLFSRGAVSELMAETISKGVTVTKFDLFCLDTYISGDLCNLHYDFAACQCYRDCGISPQPISEMHSSLPFSKVRAISLHPAAMELQPAIAAEFKQNYIKAKFPSPADIAAQQERERWWRMGQQRKN